MNQENKNNIEYWNKLHAYYERNDIIKESVGDNWLDRFDEVILPSRGPAIDLGCGSGNDTYSLISRGKKVIACDASPNAIANVERNFPEVMGTCCFDMLDSFPFYNNSTDLIIADLCLHYFKREDTIKILKEIRRILVNNGNILIRVNSMNDINHGAGNGKEVERHLYMTEDGRYKRFFDTHDIYDFFNIFDIKYVREDIMTRYKLEKRLYTIRLRNKK